MRVLSLFLSLSLLACASPANAQEVLCGVGVSIEKKGLSAELSKKVREFAGLRKGDWDLGGRSTLCGAVFVSEIKESDIGVTARVLYVQGENRRYGYNKRYIQVDGSIVDNTLTFKTEDGRPHTFTLRADGAFDGTFVSSSGKERAGVFTR